MDEAGLTIVYTGKGKGKTTAALGIALRATGYKKKICMIQFIKGSWHYGEMDSSKKLAPEFEMITAGKGFVGIIDDKSPKEDHKKIAKEAIEISNGKIQSGNYDIVILDEINYAVNLDLISIDDVLKLIKSKPRGMDLINLNMKTIEEINIANVKKISAEKKLPDFFPGDIIKVGVKITEGKRDRIQYFEGVCIAKKNRDLNSSFTVRKISFGEGVERTFALYSTIVDSIKVIRSGKVRRAKLYYLRDRTGKSARITEKIRKKIGIDVESKPEEVTEENLAPVVEEKTADKQETSEDKSETPKAETKKEEIKKDTPEEKK